LKNKNRKGGGSPLPASARAGERSERAFVVQDRFLADLQHWVLTEPRLAARVLDLMEDIKRSPTEGIGKPERLKHNLQGLWSRRINDEHRLVYEVFPDRILFVSARFHYD
jgi:toxin YoeB